MSNQDKEINDYLSYPVYEFSRYTAVLALLGHLLFLFVFLFLKIRPLVYFNVASCLIYTAAFIFNQYRYHRLILSLTLVEIVAHAFYATYLLGWGSGFYLYILCMILLVFNYRVIALSWKVVFLVCILISIVLLNLLARTWPDWNLLSSKGVANLALMNLILAFLVFLLLSGVYSFSAMELEKQLRLKNDKLESLSRTDPLTSLSNRRDIMDKIGFEKEKMVRNGNECCFIITDIDFFKNTNDRFGHDYGDFILKQVSAILRSSLRKQDHVCRWGGEEFLIVLPDTGLAGAQKVAEKLRRNIEQHCFSWNGVSTHITMTFGVALFDILQDEDTSIKKADTKLFLGKEKGRNRVES